MLFGALLLRSAIYSALALLFRCSLFSTEDKINSLIQVQGNLHHHCQKQGHRNEKIFGGGGGGVEVGYQKSSFYSHSVQDSVNKIERALRGINRGGVG